LFKNISYFEMQTEITLLDSSGSSLEVISLYHMGQDFGV